jgi:hypothetical protein
MSRALARRILLPSLLPGLRFCRAATCAAPSLSSSARSAPEEQPSRRGKRTRAWQLADGLAAGMAADIVTAGSVVLRQASLGRGAGQACGCSIAYKVHAGTTCAQWQRLGLCSGTCHLPVPPRPARLPPPAFPAL